jgi:hypothetical protein
VDLDTVVTELIVTVTISKEIRPGGNKLAAVAGLIKAAASCYYILGIVIGEDITNVVLSGVIPL